MSALPLTPGESIIAFWPDGQPVPNSPDEMLTVRPQLVTPGYLEAMGLRLIAGRFLMDQDMANSPPVFVANEAFVRAYFPGQEGVGQRLAFGQEPREIVGVVSDVHHRGLDRDPQPELYYTYRQPMRPQGTPRINLVARTSGDPISLVPFLREDVAELDPYLPVENVMTMEARLVASVAEPRFYALVLGVFAASALALALVGIYGVLSYAVSRPRREIGLRMALGADTARVRALVVSQGAWLVAIGIALGLAGALVTLPVLESLLFGVTTGELSTYVSVPAVVFLVALAACYLPALRATRVDPIGALRDE